MTTRPAGQGPDLRELLGAAADEAAAEYDVSSQLVRWAERQRAEEVSARARRRHAILAAAAVLVLVLVVGAALLVQAQQSQTSAPPAREDTDVGLPVGAWRASVAHVHLTPAGSSTVLTGVYLRADRDGTATLRLPEMNEPLDLVLVPSGSGTVRLEADPAACPGRLVLTLTITTGTHGFTVTGAQPGPCYVNASVADELVGAHFTRQEQP
jgi:hypothetical protein